MSLRYCWKKYQIKTTTTYRWNRYNLNESKEAYDSGVTSTKSLYTRTVRFYSGTRNDPAYYGSGDPSSYISNGKFERPSGYISGGSYVPGSTSCVGHIGSLSSERLDAGSDPYRLIVNMSSDQEWPSSYMDQLQYHTSGTSTGNQGQFEVHRFRIQTVYSQGSSNGTVTSTNRSAYPDNDRKGNYWYRYSKSSTTQSAGDYIEDVIGSTESQYPTNGVSGSYWYVYQGSDSIDPVAVNLSQSIGLYVGLPITISVDPSTSKVYGGTVSYQYQVQINNDGQWITLGTTTETSYSYTIPIGATNLQFRVLASDNLGFISTDYVNSASVSVVAFKPGTQQVLHRKNASGGYDVIWLETDSEVVIRPDGTTLEATLADIESRLSGLGV